MGADRVLLLGLASGVGVVLYVGLWLVLIGPRSIESSWVRYLGGIIVVAGVPLMIAAVDIEVATGPLVVLLLLIVLAVVLWQPRAERSPTPMAPLPARSALKDHRRRQLTTTSFQQNLLRWSPVPMSRSTTQRRHQR